MIVKAFTVSPKPIYGSTGNESAYKMEAKKTVDDPNANVVAFNFSTIDST
jgi:hypothetical protein